MNLQSTNFEMRDACYQALVNLDAHAAPQLFVTATTILIDRALIQLVHNEPQSIVRDVEFVLRWHKWRGILLTDDVVERSKVQDSFNCVQELFASIDAICDPIPFVTISQREFDSIPADALRINSMAFELRPPEKHIPQAENSAFTVRNLWGTPRTTSMRPKLRPHFWSLKKLEGHE